LTSIPGALLKHVVRVVSLGEHLGVAHQGTVGEAASDAGVLEPTLGGHQPFDLTDPVRVPVLRLDVEAAVRRIGAHPGDQCGVAVDELGGAGAGPAQDLVPGSGR